jgi:asparagine synthase (glutamine-hydrolysing)
VLNLGRLLGHTLSIIDLEGGVQPMKDMSGRYAITFNGEIQLPGTARGTAEEGYRFTHSDTEVIMSAYAEWGAS